MRNLLSFAAALVVLAAPAVAQDLGGILGGIAKEALEGASEARPASRLAGESDARTDPGAYVERWDSMRPVRFEHVVEGPPGPVTLILEGRTLDGNQTIAVYRVDRNGVRIPGWRLFVITTRDGNSATGTLTLPRVRTGGATLGRQRVAVMVENHSGRRSRGEFALRVVPSR